MVLLLLLLSLYSFEKQKNSREDLQVFKTCAHPKATSASLLPQLSHINISSRTLNEIFFEFLSKKKEKNDSFYGHEAKTELREVTATLIAEIEEDGPQSPAQGGDGGRFGR